MSVSKKEQLAECLEKLVNKNRKGLNTVISQLRADDGKRYTDEELTRIIFFDVIASYPDIMSDVNSADLHTFCSTQVNRMSENRPQTRPNKGR